MFSPSGRVCSVLTLLMFGSCLRWSENPQIILNIYVSRCKLKSQFLNLKTKLSPLPIIYPLLVSTVSIISSHCDNCNYGVDSIYSNC